MDVKYADLLQGDTFFDGIDNVTNDRRLTIITFTLTSLEERKRMRKRK